MKLSRALELKTEYAGKSGIIRVNKDDYICLTDLISFFPSKRLDEWRSNENTKGFIQIVEETIIPGIPGIITKKGKGGGTWAHRYVAYEFLTWLSPEFKLHVIVSFENGTQRKEDWNIKRVLAANNFKLMTEAIKHAHDEPKSYHFSNEAMMLNEIVFGFRNGNPRDTATEEQLDWISKLEAWNSGYIEQGLSYQDRKELLSRIYARKTQKAIED